MKAKRLTMMIAMTMLVAACGADAEQASSPSPTHHEPSTTAGVGDDAPEEGDKAALARAEQLLGVAEADLHADVRIGRRGAETYALTLDLVPGRITVHLDEIDGEFRVTRADVELPSGVESFEHDQ